MKNQHLDRAAGIFFALFGAWVTYGAWRMPRFEERGAQIYEAPGLAPALLGLALALCGIVLALRKPTEAGDKTSYWDEVMGDSTTRRRALAALVLTLGYGAVLFGSAPYLIATFAFVFCFISIFELVLIPVDRPKSKKSTPKILSVAALIALIVAFATQYVFQSLFLIQLP
jgi:putative tricarboxylic transport membrane protein